MRIKDSIKLVVVRSELNHGGKYDFSKDWKILPSAHNSIHVWTDKFKKMKVKTTMLEFSTARYPKIAARSKIESNAKMLLVIYPLIIYECTKHIIYYWFFIQTGNVGSSFNIQYQRIGVGPMLFFLGKIELSLMVRGIIWYSMPI